MSNYLVFDTETTGKPKNYKAAVTDLNNWPRVIQLGWGLYGSNGTLIRKRSDLIKPDGWVIPKEKFWIDNGYSTETNEAEGIPMSEALIHFIDALESSIGLVAHNMDFDHPVLGAECIRYGLRGRKVAKICTMKMGTDICRLPGFRGEFKWPNLTELHMKLFGTGFDGAHDAGADVHAAAMCFFEMKSRFYSIQEAAKQLNQL